MNFCKTSRKVLLLIALLIATTVVFSRSRKREQFVSSKNEQISVPSVAKAVSYFCKKCRNYPESYITSLASCISCFEEVHESNISTEVKARNKLLLEYHEKSKIAVKRNKRLPDVIGIGVRKCGTEWFSHVLKKHPMIKAPRQIELHFFNERHNFERGLDFYKFMLPNVNEFELAVEKTPGYFNYPRWKTSIPELVRKHIPNAKLWLILCDPIHRAVSDFMHITVLNESYLPETFEEYVEQYIPQAEKVFSGVPDSKMPSFLWSITDHSSIILSLGIYYDYLKEWLKYFPAHQIHIINGEELIKNPGGVMLKFQDFLGIPRFLLPEDFVKNAETGFYCVSPTFAIDSKLYRVPAQCMPSNYKGRTRGARSSLAVSHHTLKRLEKFYHQYNEKLYELLGTKLW